MSGLDLTECIVSFIRKAGYWIKKKKKKKKKGGYQSKLFLFQLFQNESKYTQSDCDKNIELFPQKSRQK